MINRNKNGIMINRINRKSIIKSDKYIMMSVHFVDNPSIL